MRFPLNAVFLPLSVSFVVFFRREWYSEFTESDDSVSVGSVIAPGEDGPLRDNPATIPGQWIYNSTVEKWWYRHNDGTYTTNDWEYINGKWYHFDSAGWMQTGWLYVGGKWYYLNPSTGAMVTGWRQISNNVGSYWYFFKPSGVMVTGWNTVAGYTYYFNSLGQLQETTRRAFIVGDGVKSSDLDMDGWNYCLSNLTFQGDFFDTTIEIMNPTKTYLSNRINQVMSNASAGDITYLCITCTGEQDGNIKIGTGENSTISGQELHDMLYQRPGKFVLFLSFDYSGLVINRNTPHNPEMEFLSAFTEETRSGELLEDKFVVFCSARYNETDTPHQYSEDENMNFSCANRCWMTGGGWDPLYLGYLQDMYADYNANSIVTVAELETYSASVIPHQDQHVVVYSDDCNFTIFARTDAN